MTNNEGVNVESGKQGFQPREKDEAPVPAGGLGVSEVGQPRMLDDGHRFAELMAEVTDYESATFQVHQDDHGTTVVELSSFGARGKGPATAAADRPSIEEFLESHISAEDMSALIEVQVRQVRPGIMWIVSTDTGLTAHDSHEDIAYDAVIYDRGRIELQEEDPAAYRRTAASSRTWDWR